MMPPTSGWSKADSCFASAAQRRARRNADPQLSAVGSGCCLEGVHQAGIGSGYRGKRVAAARGGFDLELAAGLGKREQQELARIAAADGSRRDMPGVSA